MKTKLTILLGTALLLAGLAFAQRTAREEEQHSVPTPTWSYDPEFERDVFTFARVRYNVDGRYGYGQTGERWKIDFPDCDLNISYRLQQMTSLKVDPNGRVIDLTDKELFNYPFIYIVEPGRLTFEDEEVPILRRYLLNGGFLMVDDFWGDREWNNFEEQMRVVFPDRNWVELDPSHPIFNSIFQLSDKPQVPGIRWGTRGMDYESRSPGSEEVHYRAIFDSKDRMMVLICHNTDLGDGWEREGENQEYFHKYSEKKAYPMGINIIFHAMTH